ncbi:unnamed protein product, partial [Ectocarpus sp. 6 AP-2014]
LVAGEGFLLIYLRARRRATNLRCNFALVCCFRAFFPRRLPHPPTVV